MTDEELIQALTVMERSNNFARSLVRQYRSGKVLTHKQTQAALAMLQRENSSKLESTMVDLSAIRKMFDSAVANGLEKPKYRAEGLIISRAPDSGRNAGALYVVDADDDCYLGKIVSNRYYPMIERENTALALMEIAKNPEEAAIRYGRLTGQCSCCGRTLTNHASIEAGIGPICAEKWGF